MNKTDWTFGGEWPFEPKWFDTPDGKMHYIDEGPKDGRPIIMVHGNPTWGYPNMRAGARLCWQRSISEMRS